jgi:hypothetical protein
MEWTTGNTRLEVWEERDRLHVALEYGDTTVCEWWDDDARQMFEDGFFDRDCLHESVVECANDHGFVVTCQCVDPGCPCGGSCQRVADSLVYRVDMDDDDGTPMCGRCSADALESGVFRLGEDEVVDDLDRSFGPHAQYHRGDA